MMKIIWNKIWDAYSKEASFLYFFKEVLWNNDGTYLALYYLSSAVFWSVILFWGVIFGFDQEDKPAYLLWLYSSAGGSVFMFLKLKEKRFDKTFHGLEYKEMESQYGEFQLASRFKLFCERLSELNITDVEPYIKVCKSEYDYFINRFQYAKSFSSVVLTIVFGVTVALVKDIEFIKYGWLWIGFYAFVGLVVYLMIYFPFSLLKTRAEKLNELNLFLHLYQLDQQQLEERDA